MLKIDDAILAVVDIQGKLATLMHEKETFYKNAEKMIKGCQVLEVPVLWTEQVPEKLGETIPQIKNLFGSEKPMTKIDFSCSGAEGFLDRLRESKRHQVMVIGMETHICVYQTVVDLLKEGYEVYLIADAVSSRFEVNKQIGIEACIMEGAKISCVEMALFEMMRKAGGDKFRQVSKIVK